MVVRILCKRIGLERDGLSSNPSWRRSLYSNCSWRLVSDSLQIAPLLHERGERGICQLKIFTSCEVDYVNCSISLSSLSCRTWELDVLVLALHATPQALIDECVAKDSIFRDN
jgi:hypothetical protein